MIDVSVVIVSYNTRELLRDCLRSVSDQSKEVAVEAIVVDNASQDESQSMVKTEFPFVTLLENTENLGFAKANNLGIRASKGRYVALVNSDVVVLEGCLQRLVRFMDAHPAVGMVGPRILNADRSLQPSCRTFPSLWNNFSQAIGLSRLFPRSSFFGDWSMKYWAHDTVREVDALSGCFWMLRQKALDEVGLLDERFFMYGEDLDWCRRFHDAGWGVHFYPEAEAVHFGGASSASAPVKFFLEMQKADLQYWKKHHGRFRQICYAAIIFLRHTTRLLGLGIGCLVCPKRKPQVAQKIRNSWACIQWLLRLRKVESE